MCPHTRMQALVGVGLWRAMSVAACRASRRLRSSLRLLYDFHTLQARHAAATAADANAASHVPLRCMWCAQPGGMQWRQPSRLVPVWPGSTDGLQPVEHDQWVNS